MASAKVHLQHGMQSDVVSLEEWRRVENLQRAQPGSPGKLTHVDNGSPHRESTPASGGEEELCIQMIQ